MKIGSLLLIAVLGFCLNTLVFGEDPHDLVMQGWDLTPDEASILEANLERDPYDLRSRAQLLGYYWGEENRDDRSAQEKQANHVLWLIRNAPEAAVLGIAEGTVEAWRNAEGYKRTRKAWLEQIERNPGNTKILGHAAEAFIHEDLPLAMDLVRRAQSLDGSNPEWSKKLGFLYSLDAITWPGETKGLASKALAQLERAYDLSDGDERDALLVDLARAAFQSGEHAKAREFAEAALRDNREGWNQGNRTHYGHVTLGRIALAESNIEEAKYRLIAAATITGSPQLDSFGPDMTLAEELLGAGEREVVLKYFELCSSFWEMGQEELADWTALVKAGRTPDLSDSQPF
jgi:hypothetical protein